MTIQTPDAELKSQHEYAICHTDSHMKKSAKEAVLDFAWNSFKTTEENNGEQETAGVYIFKNFLKNNQWKNLVYNKITTVKDFLSKFS